VEKISLSEKFSRQENFVKFYISSQVVVVFCLFWILQTILTHSRSRVVLHLLKEAAQAKKWFKVYVTESLPDHAGW